MTDTLRSCPLDPFVLDLARSQHGMVTTAQANDLGLDAYALVGLVKAGILIRPGRGLYAVASLVDRSPLAWHRHLTHGARLLHDDVVITGVTSLIAHDVTVWHADLMRPQVLRPHRSSTLAPDSGPGRQSEVSLGEGFALGPSVPLAEALVDYAIEGSIEPAVVSMVASIRRRSHKATRGRRQSCERWFQPSIPPLP